MSRITLWLGCALLFWHDLHRQKGNAQHCAEFGIHMPISHVWPPDHGQREIQGAESWFPTSDLTNQNRMGWANWNSIKGAGGIFVQGWTKITCPLLSPPPASSSTIQLYSYFCLQSCRGRENTNFSIVALLSSNISALWLFIRMFLKRLQHKTLKPTHSYFCHLQDLWFCTLLSSCLKEIP